MSTVPVRLPVTKPLLRMGTPKPLPPDPRAYETFRVTQKFGSLDGFFPGQVHGALDIGNFRCGDPAVTPIAGTVARVRDSAGALGIVIRSSVEPSVTYELWHLNGYTGPSTGFAPSGTQIGIVGRTGLGDVCHMHIELKVLGVKRDPEPYFFGTPLVIGQEDTMPRLRPVREQWDIPAGTPFWLDGPEQGIPKSFTSPERRWSISESVDSLWRTIEYDSEVLWVKRVDIVPRAGTRNPRTGYGTPSLGLTETQAKARELNAADKVLEAAKAAAKTYGAT
jgi:hypothetical protein